MQTTLTTDGVYPFTAGAGKQVSVALSGTFDGASVTVGYATTLPVAATLDVDDADETPAFTLFANNGGTQGNNYTLALIDDGPEVDSLSVTQTGTDFVITLATDSGDAATLTTAMTGADNDITITADTAGTAGNAYSIELLAGSGTTQDLLVSTVDNLKYSVLLKRTANAIASTATEVVAALNAYAPFAALMTAAVKGGDSGAGVVTALAESDLTGGGGNHAITTTAADLVTFINATPAFAPHFTAELVNAYDGSGLAVALAEDAFTGGTFGTFAAAATAATAAGIVTARNVGVSQYMALTVTNDGESTDIDAIVTNVQP
jgi:hypothetical protein